MIPQIINNKISERYSNKPLLRLYTTFPDAAKFGFELADAVGFAEWVIKSGYYSYTDKTRKFCTSIPTRNNTVYTTSELYELYLKSKQ